MFGSVSFSDEFHLLRHCVYFVTVCKKKICKFLYSALAFAEKLRSIWDENLCRDCMREPHALLDAATEAMTRAIAPYSGFKVGAALQTKDGKIITGHNIETSSYSLTICAERVALFKALSEGEREFEAIAIVASSGDFCPPCGACRQTLIDFAPHLVVYLSNRRGQVKMFKLSDLLPESFSSANLSPSFSKRSDKSNAKLASTNSNINADATTTSQAKSKARSSKGTHRKN